jgi:hypothetical protein
MEDINVLQREEKEGNHIRRRQRQREKEITFSSESLKKIRIPASNSPHPISVTSYGGLVISMTSF